MKLSPHQLFMLRMFEKGWGFKMYNSKPGSWTTYWSLRRRGFIGKGPTIHRAGNLVAVDRLTDKGRAALAINKGVSNEPTTRSRADGARCAGTY